MSADADTITLTVRRRMRRRLAMSGVASMGINDLILVGTGFVLARVVYLFYMAPKKAEAKSAGRR